MVFAKGGFNNTEAVDNLETKSLVDGNNAKRVIQVDSSGNLKASGFSIPEYDYISRTLTDSVTETYLFKSGGSGGSTVATITVVYTDSTLTNILTATKT